MHPQMFVLHFVIHLIGEMYQHMYRTYIYPSPESGREPV